MKKILAFLLTLILLLSVCSTAFAEDSETNAEPAFERPVSVSVVDEEGTPVLGAALQLSDSEGNILETWDSDGEQVFFLKEGAYTVENLSVPEDYLGEAEPVELNVARAEEEQRPYTGAVVYDHAHPEICNKSSHIGLELYTVTGSDGSFVAYCFNHGKKNPTGDNNYKEYVATPELLFNYAKNKADGITANELYNHVLSIIYNSAAVQSRYNQNGIQIDDDMIRYLTYMAIKNFTDPKCFVQFDENGNSLLMRDTSGRPMKDENGNYLYKPGGCVLGSIINHAKTDHKNESDYVFPQAYIDAYNELINSTQHPTDYYLYFYYPENYDINNDDSDQILMSVKQAPATNVKLTVSVSAQFAVTVAWNIGNSNPLRPSPSRLASKVQLFANDRDVTAQYRSNLEIADNGDNTYTIRFNGLPKLTENGEAIVYTLKFKSMLGLKADKSVAENGQTVTFSLTELPKLKKLEPVPIIPRPFDPIIIGPINPVKP